MVELVQLERSVQKPLLSRAILEAITNIGSGFGRLISGRIVAAHFLPGVFVVEVHSPFFPREV
jgi:hypothetical protein